MYISKRVGAWRVFIRSWRVIVLIAAVVLLTTVVHIELLDTYLEVTIAVAAVGTAVSFFIGFFTAQAYDRWWEARKIWGELVNDSRSFGRMVSTVFPPYYSSMIELSIWGYIVVFALALSEQVGDSAMPYVFLTGVLFHLVYDTGRLLLDPFEGTPNDIPMSSIVRTIEINLLEQLGEKELPSPVEAIDGRYLM